MTRELKEVLMALKARQEELGIKSEWVFCKKSGEWITVKGYISALDRVCKALALPISNNHAFRMAYNSTSQYPTPMTFGKRKRTPKSIDL